MKAWIRNPILLAVSVYLFIGIRRISLPAAFVLCGMLWYLRAGKKAMILTMGIFLLCSIPHYDSGTVNFTEGKAVSVQNTYTILQNGRQKVLVYTDEVLMLDAVYAFKGDVKKIEGSNSFYGSDFSQWAYSNGVFFSVHPSSLHEVKQSHSIRSFLQKKIQDITQPEKQQLLYQTLLNIRISEQESFFYTAGFSLSGILAAADLILKYFMDRKKRKHVLLVMNVLLGMIYHWPLLLVQALIFRLLSYVKTEAHVRCGIGLTLVMLHSPESAGTLSFLIPAVFRLCALFKEDSRYLSFTAVLFLQGLNYGRMKPLQSLCYSWTRVLLGLFWMLGMLDLFLGTSFILTAECLSALYDRMDRMFILNGSPYGPGLLFFLVLCFLCRTSRYCFRWYCAFLLLFQITGLFHPFASITFIDVGQGDAILLKGPLNSSAVLIDTGRPSQVEKLSAYLQAEGVRRLDVLILTHADEDHAGNKEYVLDHFKVNRVIDSHYEKLQVWPYVLYDLNTLDTDDENESSLTAYFALNGIEVFLTGDCTKAAEEEMIRRYSRLHADILKLGHHGSATSSSAAFLDTLKPGTAIISSGPYSMYHHPSEEVIQRLLKRHIPYFDTKTEGDIAVISLPGVNLLLCASGKVAIIGP